MQPQSVSRVRLSGTQPRLEPVVTRSIMHRYFPRNLLNRSLVRSSEVEDEQLRYCCSTCNARARWIPGHRSLQAAVFCSRPSFSRKENTPYPGFLLGRIASYNRRMASEEQIRLMCVRVVRTHGPELEMNLLELFSVLKEHFEARRGAEPFVELVRAALQKPPDA
jgi:hypothetical protein